MAGVADRLVIEFTDLAEKSVGQRRRSARGLKRLERRKSVKAQRFELGHRLDLGYPAAADHACDLDVLVDQALDREYELIVERRFGLLRQAADANMDLGNLVKPGRTVHRQDRHHSGCKSAIGNNVDTRGPSLVIKAELFVNNVVITAEVAKIGSGRDGRPRQRHVIPVIYARDHRVVTGHQACDV